MPEFDQSKLDDMMRKITALIANADDPATPPAAAETYRNKAESLMRQYRIEESTLAASGKLEFSIKPGERAIVICPLGSDYRQAYLSMFSAVISHVGAMAVYNTEMIDGRYVFVGHMTGYESDLRYAEVLYQSAHLLFSSRMEPQRDQSKSDQENVYLMRQAGMERIRIAEVMGWAKGGAKVTRLYKAECEARGEEPLLTGRGTDVRVFRDAYVSGFNNELWTRLYNARNAADGNDGALVLANREEMVKEAFYERYPQLRPSTEVTLNPRKSRRKGWTAADERKWMRQQSGAGQAGRNAGAQAAREVDVNQAGRKSRLSE